MLFRSEGDVRDELSSFNRSRTIVVGDATRGVRVNVRYGGHAGVWSARVSQIGEGVPMFPVTIVEADPTRLGRKTLVDAHGTQHLPLGEPALDAAIGAERPVLRVNIWDNPEFAQPTTLRFSGKENAGGGPDRGSGRVSYQAVLDKSLPQPLAGTLTFDVLQKDKHVGGSYDLATLDGKVTRLTQAPGGQLNPIISPAGAFVSFVRDQNLYVQRVGGGDAVALTDDGAGTVHWGESEIGRAHV